MSGHPPILTSNPRGVGLSAMWLSWQYGVLVLIGAFCASAPGQGVQTPGETRQNFERRLETELAPLEERRAALGDLYVERMTRKQARFEAAGDLEAAFKIKAEIEFFKKEGEPPEQPFPEIAAFRNIFEKEQLAIQRQQSGLEIQLRTTFINGLTKLQSDATKSGDLETASGFKKQIEQHQNQIVALRAAAVDKPVVQTFSIVAGEDASDILAAYNPRNNLALNSKISVSSTWQKVKRAVSQL